MECAGCGVDIQSGFAFCPQCGTRQPVPCAACGNPCQPDFAFCPRCGASIEGKVQSVSKLSVEAVPSKSAGDADRRPVTVLFADLCGFTTLSEQIDPEVMRVLQNELFEEMTQAVEAYGGFVDKFVGDALLALFGAPVAHEDDPVRALGAALDMIRRAAEVGERWHARAGVPLRLHIGINSGPVVTGGFGAVSTKSYSVTGDTVNTAQRLQSMAGENDILVGPLTYRLTRHAFAFDSLGAQTLRGKSGNVLVHRLTGLLEAPHTARGLESLGLQAPMIGRDTELSRLLTCLDLACGGAAQLVRLIGEAGIGKSRLANEFVAIAGTADRFQGLAIRKATCSPLGEQSYGTLAAVVRSAYGIGERDDLDRTRQLLATGFRALDLTQEDVEGLLPLFQHVLGLGDPDGALRHIEPEQLRRQIFYAVRTVFERRLAQSPLLLVIEDLHWADAASLEVLRFMMDRLERSRLMLLAIYRPTSQTDPLDSHRVNVTVQRLGPLAAADGQRLLAALFGEGHGKLPVAMRKRILDRAGGNPLFIEEILRALIDMGTLHNDGQRWHLAAEDTDVDIPVNLQALLLARVDRLPQEIRRLAQEAAVVGPKFDTALLRAITADPSAVDAALDYLCDANITEELRGPDAAISPGYRFSQTLMHDVVYHNLLLQRRMELHLRIGRVLERQYGLTPERPEHLTQLGHHFSLTAEKAKGASYLMAAGDLARKTYANDDAMRLYRQALAVFANEPEATAEQLALLERLADLCAPAGRRDDALNHYQQALAIHRARDDRIAAARILRKIGRLHLDAGRRDQAETHCAAAEVMIAAIDAPVEHAHLLQERGHLAFRMGDQAAAADWATQALQCLQTLPIDGTTEAGREAARAMAEALNTKGAALARLGRRRDAVLEVEHSLSVAEKADLQSAACRAYSNLGVLYTIVDPARAIKICRRGLEVATRIGDLGFQARLLANLAVSCCTFTDRCAAEGVPAAEKAVEIDRALDQRDHLSVPLIVLGQIHQCHGQPKLARKYYEEALEVAKEIDEPQLLFPCYDGLATLSLEHDDMDEAERYFTLAQDVCMRHNLDPGTLVVLPFLD
ncbi:MULTISPECIES: adenylate/guanylate cyclase domain-containing protein [Rhizobium]|uniref:adenylate/guanylate cyclase domain-containing protein n=1 Tax=Rhizobium TaxID=379 RepID=UPI00234F8B2B|nr:MULTISPECIES: adenylate/guanylate cyclase domain-containing protein [unclassified Rhizobium]MDC7742360.1 adenylate/guanylate cyclase domain-containing protein [Rhizobium sp. BC56]MDC9813297.1 adenylate/guanylate cyclase domain-containing protein [Rhizobium sp. MC62]MDC9837014.1 adenylate/guanylate cyclase domain-containing protein [Rhizobium sp. MJ37]WEA27522.1 adenylate/guanylate cyclase domain-containing protein [Rhizobium sp. MJ22]WEA61990.1 adenylate/guanylate cyclase domain-containing 